jgi:hypothetical protein
MGKAKADTPVDHSTRCLSVFAALYEGKMVADSCLRKDLYPPTANWYHLAMLLAKLPQAE